MKKILLGVVVALSALGVSQAALIPTFVSMSNPSPGVFAYDYDVVVRSPDQRLQPTSTAGPGNNPPAGFNDHFTFLDFAGYNGVALYLSGAFSGSFTASSATTGPSTFGISPVDSASIPNVTFTYTGSSTIATGATLGRFRVESSIGNTNGSVEFLGQGTTNAPGTSFDGTVSSNLQFVAGPSGTVVIPEPLSMILFGSGLIGIALAHRRITRKRR